MYIKYPIKKAIIMRRTVANTPLCLLVNLLLICENRLGTIIASSIKITTPAMHAIANNFNLIYINIIL